ncbi:MAG: hypothetical protein ABI905_00585 [Betaproteobacteria bacterium]
MKSKLLVGTLISTVALFAVPFGANAAEDAGESDCAECSAPTELATDKAQKMDAITIVAPKEAAPTACGGSAIVKSAESLNEKIKPIREIAGYVRSPQGLAIKLVNDHVVKIPAWVGYAMDPVGSIKNKALDEVRTRAKNAIQGNNSCEEAAVTAPANTDTQDEEPSKQSI